jgi:4-amino-4-deoxy-L-arabinose transferase-like glycosyltransferase
MMFRAWCAAALLALVLLVVRDARTSIAGEYIDPIGRVTAQDEAFYASSAIAMANGAGWLTPPLPGPLALHKPPLLVWLTAGAVKIAGASRVSLRLPVSLLCAMAAGLVFLWAAELQSSGAGLLALALLVSDRLWHVLGTLTMTDGLLAAFVVAAMYCLYTDPWLKGRSTRWGFAASCAGAVLAKSVAGVLPLAVLPLYCVAGPKRYRPNMAAALITVGLAASLSVTWFAYEAIVHGRWFWTRHVPVETAPPQTSQENHILFYVLRLALTDPFLVAALAAAIPLFLREIRRRRAGATLLACWLALAAVSVLVWRDRNITYLLPAIPALAIVAACYSPVAQLRLRWAGVLAAALLAVKAAMPAAPWGISFGGPGVQAAAPALQACCNQRPVMSGNGMARSDSRAGRPQILRLE